MSSLRSISKFDVNLSNPLHEMEDFSGKTTVKRAMSIRWRFFHLSARNKLTAV
jgi:hypothetical protein